MRKRLKYIKIIILSWAILLTLTTPLVSAQKEICDNSITITGSTNLNQFHFIQTFPNRENSSLQNNTWRLEETPQEFRIHIPVNNFEANNRIMFADFMELLKSDQFPTIIISLNKEAVYKIQNKEANLTQKVKIDLAGVTREYIISCESMICLESGLFIAGSREVKLTDFKLSPP